MKLYLAHPLECRKEVREIELQIEAETGIELYNPFYDAPGRDDIEDIDSGLKTRWQIEDYMSLVFRDLQGVNQSDGVVAYVTRGQFMVGTVCEMWHCIMSRFKPVYIVTPDAAMHPWIRFIAEFSGGKIFASWDEFKSWLMNRVAV